MMVKMKVTTAITVQYTATFSARLCPPRQYPYIMYSEMQRDRTAMQRTVICGHCGVEAAQGGRLLRGAKFLEVLNITNVDTRRPRTTVL